MKASSSLEQQNIEKYILETLNKQEGLDLRPTKLKLDENREVQWMDTMKKTAQYAKYMPI